MKTELTSLFLIGVLGCLCSLFLKQYQKTAGVLCSLAVCGVILGELIPEIRVVFQTAEQIYEKSPLDKSYFLLLCKAVGIACLTQIGTEFCKDCGENAIGTMVLLCGRVFLISLTLPLFLTLAEQILEILP